MMEEHDATESADPTGTVAGEPVAPAKPTTVPSLPVRLVQTFTSPAKMAATVAEHPRWVGAMLVSAVLLALSQALIPLEVLEEAQRRMMIAQGQSAPEIPENARQIIRAISIVAPAVAYVIMSFIGAGLTTFIFAFVLGDEGSYRQYLAIGVHAAIIVSLTQVLLAPMRVAAEDPQLTINLATFLPFLPDGYVYNLFRMADLSQIWSTLVTAAGIHAIDRRRSFASAAAIQFAVLLVLLMVIAWFVTRAVV